MPTFRLFSFLKGGQAVYIPQPYYTAKYEGFDGLGLTRKLAEDVGRMKCVRKHLSGMRLVVKYAGSGRSWYYPGRSALWAIGAPEAVESMNFEYEPPPPPAEVARYGEEPVKVAPEDFDAPCPLPTWEIQLPVWTCQFVTNRGNLCGKPSVGRSWPPTWGHRLVAGGPAVGTGGVALRRSLCAGFEPVDLRESDGVPSIVGKPNLNVNTL